MLRNLIILILSIICSYSILYAQEQKVLLVGECSKSGTDKMLQYLEKNGQINLLSENNVNITKYNINSKDNIPGLTINQIINNKLKSLNIQLFFN